MQPIDKFRAGLCLIFGVALILIGINEINQNKATFDKLETLVEEEKSGVDNTSEIQELLNSLGISMSPNSYRKSYQTFRKVFRTA